MPFSVCNSIDCQEFACRIPKDNSNELYSLQTFWFQNKVIINIWDQATVWSGEVTKETLLEFSNMLGIREEEYFLECMRVLTKNGGDSQFVYGIENSFFVWKKIDPASNAKFKFGSVEVKNVPFTDEGIAILNHSFNSVLRLKAALLVEEERKLKTEEAMKNLKQKLTKLCKEKEVLEKELYVKFLSILNKKKEKIRTLEQCCEDRVSPKKVKSNHIYSDTDSDLDDANSTVCGISVSTSVKQQMKVVPKQMGRQQKQKSGMMPTPLELKLSMPTGGAGESKDHYDSDTDVDMATDDEERPTFTFVSSEPKVIATNHADSDLFSEMNSPPVVLPKRIRRGANIEENKPGPSLKSSRTAQLPPVVELQTQALGSDFTSQDLFDDLGRD